jgi:hypothetical protein
MSQPKNIHIVTELANEGSESFWDYYRVVKVFSTRDKAQEFIGQKIEKYGYREDYFQIEEHQVN